MYRNSIGFYSKLTNIFFNSNRKGKFMENTNRYTALDILRGFALINMIIYHAIWDMVNIFNIKMPWFTSRCGFIWQQIICCTFILLSGFCFNLGSHKLKRGLTVIGCSIAISLITAVFMPKNIILFGVLSLIGSGMLIMIPLDKVFKKINPYIGLIIFICLFVCLRNVNQGGLPEVWYANLITAYLGFPPDSFVSQDYFSLIPWLFLYIAGYFLYGIFKNQRFLTYLTLVQNKPLEWIGRHSLIIYMAHQPILYVLLSLIYKFI